MGRGALWLCAYLAQLFIEHLRCGFRRRVKLIQQVLLEALIVFDCGLWLVQCAIQLHDGALVGLIKWIKFIEAQ